MFSRDQYGNIWLMKFGVGFLVSLQGTPPPKPPDPNRGETPQQMEVANEEYSQAIAA